MSEEESPKRRVLVTPVEPMDAFDDEGKPIAPPKKPDAHPADEKREAPQPTTPNVPPSKNRQR